MTWNKTITGAIGLGVGIVAGAKVIKDITSIKGLDYREKEDLTMASNDFCFGDGACIAKKRKAAGGECREGRPRPSTRRPRGRR